MATWTFPILKDNYSEELTSRTIRSDMDVGPAKVRRRTILPIKNVSFSMYLNHDEYENFEQFYLNNDVVVFDFPNPRTGVNCIARFTKPFKGSYQTPFWNVSVSLEILP